MKILALDIETSPNVVYTWGLFDQNVGLNQVIETGGVLCFAAKWLGEKKVQFWSVERHGRQAMLEAAHVLLDEADVVMHYNGKRFDIPHLNREFVEAGFGPPSPYQQIDLYLTAKSKFKFQSNRLEHVSKQLGLKGKVEHAGFGLWRKCMDGLRDVGEGRKMSPESAAAWRSMERYNKRDVTLLEELHDILLPWIPNYPSRALIDHRPGSCPKCGSTELQRRGVAYTRVSEYPQFQCQACGSWFRGTGRSRQAGVSEVSV